MTGSPQDDLPRSPFPGIHPYGFTHRYVFFAREVETRALTRLVAMYRGVLLYAASGTGKSSLLNAGLIPNAFAEGLQPERIRVQPRRGQEIIVQRISTVGDEQPPFLPSVFGSDDGVERVVFSTEQFLEHTRRQAQRVPLLLVFDQFEEWITLFEDGSPDARSEQARQSQAEIGAAIATLINDGTLPVKVVLSLREDYLAKLASLFKIAPTLPDQHLRLTPLSLDQVFSATRGPFEAYPGRYSPEFSVGLARSIRDEFEKRSGSGDVHLTEVQIVCSHLYEVGNRTSPEEEFASQGGVQGILEQYLEHTLASLEGEHQEAAVALLARMLTSAGTRNVISREDLLKRVEYEDHVSRDIAAEALDDLERNTALVRRERRREVYYYEIASEFLVEWIRAKAAQRERVLELRNLEERHRAAEEERRAKTKARAYRWLWRLAAGLAVSLLVTAMSWRAALHESARAQHALGQVKISELKAVEEANLAKLNAGRAAVSMQRAMAAEADSSKLADEAQQAREEADARRGEMERFARSTQVASTAVASLGVDPERSLLLALESISANGGQITPETQNALHRAIQTSRVRLAVQTFGSVPTRAVFDRVGDRFATAHPNGTVVLWDARSGAAMGTIFAHPYGVATVAFDPREDRLVTGGDDGCVRVWNAATRRLIVTLRGHLDRVKAVAFSRDGRFIASAGTDGMAIVWDATTGRLVRAFDDVHANLEHVEFGPDGDWIVTAGSKLQTWDIASGAPLREFGKPGDRTYVLAVDSSGARLPSGGVRVVTGEGNGAVTVWDSMTGQTTDQQPIAHTNIVTGVAVSADGGRIASVGFDGVVKVWDNQLRQELFSLAGHTALLSSVGFSPDGDRLLTASYDGTARIWSRWSEEYPAVAIGSTSVTGLSFVGRSPTIAATAGRGGLRLLDGASGRIVRKVISDASAVTAMGISSDQSRVAVVGSKNTVEILDLASETRLSSLVGHKGRVTRVAFSRDGLRVATASDDRTARVWDVASGRVIRTLEGHADEVLSVAFSPDGRSLATASKDRSGRLWDLTSEKFIELKGHLIGLTDVAFSPTRPELATTSKDRTVIVWNIRSGAPLRTLTGHTDSVMGLAYSPDGAQIATVSLDKSLKIWDPASGREITTLAEVEAPVERVAYSADGRRIAIGGDDGVVRIYATSTDDLLRLARSRITRSLTAAECIALLDRPCPPSGMALREEAGRLMRKLDVKGASAAFQKAARLDPSLGIDPGTALRNWIAAGLLPLLTNQGLSSQQRAKYAENLMVIEPAMRISVREIEATMAIRAATDLAREGKLAEATTLFDAATRLDDALKLDGAQMSRRLYARALVRTALDTRGPDIAKQFELAVAHDERYSPAYIWLAAVHSQNNRNESIRWARLGAERAPRADLLVFLGELYLAAGRYQEAAEAARSVLKLTPNNGCAHVVLGRSERALQHAEVAVRYLTQVKETDPCYDLASAVLAQVHFEDLFQFEVAYRVYAQVLAKKPDSASDIANFAEASLATSRFDEAITLARRVLAGPPQVDEPATVSTKLAIQFIELVALTMDGKPEDAQSTMRELIALYNSNGGKYEQTWSYNGTEQFLKTCNLPEQTKRTFLNLVTALKSPRAPLKMEDFPLP